MRDDPQRAIFAVSYRKTPQHFPLPWASTACYVSAVNVTDRYTNRGTEIPAGQARLRFRKLGLDERRQSVAVTVINRKGKKVFAGTTNDEKFDANDHLTAILKLGGV
ncbi:MAG: hypothetical protein V3W41_16600 [Planctomycetota bacterium]